MLDSWSQLNNRELYQSNIKLEAKLIIEALKTMKNESIP